MAVAPDLTTRSFSTEIESTAVKTRSPEITCSRDSMTPPGAITTTWGKEGHVRHSSLVGARAARGETCPTAARDFDLGLARVRPESGVVLADRIGKVTANTVPPLEALVI